MTERLKEIYAEYARQAQQVRKKARVTDGMFGMGEDPKKDPCHTAFYENVAGWIDAFCATNPTAEAAAETLLFMLEAPAGQEKKDSYWMMFAALGPAWKLVPLLDKAGAEAAFVRMGELYPAHLRMPAQEQLFRDLNRKAGQTNRFWKRK